jgi:DNA replication protein DnaC
MSGITGQESPDRTPQLCSRHGTVLRFETIEAFGKSIPLGTGCVQCDQDAAEDEQRREEKRREADFLRAQDEAGIPPRYRTATLGTFPVSAPGQDKVINDAKEFISTSGIGSTGLILLGKVGSGKSHLACGVLNAIIRKGLAGKYFSTLQAVRLIKESWGKEAEKTERQTLSSFLAPHLLVLDEVGIQHGTDSEYLILSEIVGERYNRLKPTVLISNLTMTEFTDLLGERVVDRFKEGGRVLVFDWGSLRLRK